MSGRVTPDTPSAFSSQFAICHESSLAGELRNVSLRF